VNLFLDNCLAVKHARALNALLQPEHSLTHLRDRFAPDTPDADWLSALAREGGWTLLSGDYRISRSVHEREAWHESGITAFFLAKGWQNLPLMEQHAKLARCLPEILKHAAKARRGTGFVITVNGKIEQIYP
jgi:hypothetical protein